MRSILRRSAVFLVALGLLSAVGTAHADVNPRTKLKQHVRSMVQKVKAAPTAEQKRALLDEKLRDMIDALDRAAAMANLSSSDQEGVDALRTRLQEKLDELHGQNGYDAVPAGQLNSFADYVQQDFEQADRTLTISLTTALLVLLLLVLLV